MGSDWCASPEGLLRWSEREREERGRAQTALIPRQATEEP